VILCERGVRGFDSPSRNLLDVGAIPVLHRLSHLPVMADPSHGTGRSDLVPAMARAAVAAGADGLLIEVHHDPENARSDGAQSLCPPAFADLMRDLRDLAPIVGRRLGGTVGVPA
jgi:3-deoxy-7-phosphoheptulonate synthase